MSEKPTYKELEKRIWELEKAENKWKIDFEALLDSEKRYKSLIHKIQAAIVVHDIDIESCF